MGTSCSTQNKEYLQIIPEPNWGPSAFHMRLFETARILSHLEGEDKKNPTFNMLLSGQSAPDIQKKLQKIDKISGMSISQLTEITCKLYNNRE